MRRPKQFFRAGVGAVIVNAHGQILVLRRSHITPEAWQMPQGGMKRGEEPEVAVLREVEEETGLTAVDIEILGSCKAWLAYELPPAYRSPKVGRGQVQKWFVCRLIGPESHIKPDQVEFDRWRWMSPAELLRCVVEFRVDVYQRVLGEFAAILDPART